MNRSAIIFSINLRTWLWTLLGAMGVNLFLFLLMPYLLHYTTGSGSLEPPAALVNIIRIKRPETEPEPPKKQPPQPEEKKPPSKPKVTAAAAQKLALPFTINPRLPSGPTTLDLPDIQTSSLGSPDLGKPFSSAQLDNPLQVLARIPPIYPISAKRRGVEGWVKVRFVVDKEGRVTNIDILAAEPAGIFEQSVQRCVSGWKFSPGTVEGMPVETWVETVIRFKLE